MSPEWMIALDRAEKTMKQRRIDPLSDPLEAQAWRGLEAVSALLARLLNGRGRPEPRGTRRPCRAGLLPCVQARVASRPDLSLSVLYSLSRSGGRNRRKCAAAAGSAAMQDPSNGL